MKKLWAVVVVTSVLLVALPSSAQAGEGRPAGWGVGIGWGTGVSGLSLKNQSGDTALQGVIGCGWRWGWGRRGRHRRHCRGIGVSGDLLFNQSVLTDEGTVRLAWNVGPGAALGVIPDIDEIWLAGQFVAGLEFIFPEVPLDVVLEWRPSLFVIPDAGFWVGQLGFHVRYYFQ